MSLPRDCSRDEWPLKAYKNLDFLNSDAARNIRVLCEMTEPGLRFAEESIQDTIVLFGSARLQPEADAKEALETLVASFENPEAPTEAEKFSQLRAESGVKSAHYYSSAVELAEKLTRWSLKREAEGKPSYTICSGGGPGIMEAANLGAKKAGGKSIGLGISLPFEQGVNDSVPEELKFEFHYFFVRKFWFVSMAKVLVAFPGGFGTLDELFETLTLVQTKKIEEKPIIVLFGSKFWNSVINFEALVEWGTISPGDLHLFKIIDDVDEAAKYIIDGLTKS
ncbi:lysine decarboxylase [Coraliomargarita sinensis]|uniref:AMP nucleosidase n=1 Tax=Coraliomargarita sinensis TaxID=2174842 RepID=A0A317ZD20_9BACT|nr:LOG family protein [Coraliomargarita sinensis]PXA03144.1 lysine decarboxylase [Coraliomargarita sinensis]